jgi:hypothetical protein
VVLVRAKVDARFVAEALVVGPDVDAPQLDFLDLAEVVDEVCVHDRALALLEQLHQPADAPTSVFEHRQRDINPPLFAC